MAAISFGLVGGRVGVMAEWMAGWAGWLGWLTGWLAGWLGWLAG